MPSIGSSQNSTMDAHSGGSSTSWHITRVYSVSVDVVNVLVVVELVVTHELHLAGQSSCTRAIVTGFVHTSSTYSVHAGGSSTPLHRAPASAFVLEIVLGVVLVVAVSKDELEVEDEVLEVVLEEVLDEVLALEELSVVGSSKEPPGDKEGVSRGFEFLSAQYHPSFPGAERVSLAFIARDSSVFVGFFDRRNFDSVVICATTIIKGGGHKKGEPMASISTKFQPAKKNIDTKAQLLIRDRFVMTCQSLQAALQRFRFVLILLS
eukprot:gene22101-30222_t